MRPIDGDKLIKNLQLIATCWSISPFVSKEKHNGAVDMLREVEREVKEMPTLTQPNETPPCYQPDGDGCAYQCYDGQDEPIEKCKACPLCCSDKQRHYTPPNEPLTIEQLREMDGQPVWIKRLKGVSVCDTDWAVVDVCPNKIRVWWFGSEVEDEPSEKDYGETWLAYRRPPEGEANA